MTTFTLPDVETRQLDAAPDLTVTRAAEPDAAPRFAGHALVTSVRTAIGNPLSWGFYEEMAPGVADRTIVEDDQRMLIDHDTALIVARRSAGDLRLSSDSTGLAVDADLDTQVAYIADLARNVERKRLTGMSVGFRVRSDEWNREQVELPAGQTVEVEVRTITDIELLEVSVVTFPAYPTTDAALRSLREARGLSLTRPAQRDDAARAARQLAMRHDLTARRRH